VTARCVTLAASRTWMPSPPCPGRSCGAAHARPRTPAVCPGPPCMCEALRRSVRSGVLAARTPGSGRRAPLNCLSPPDKMTTFFCVRGSTSFCSWPGRACPREPRTRRAGRKRPAQRTMDHSEAKTRGALSTRMCTVRSGK
jgi:hypothetical protein